MMADSFEVIIDEMGRVLIPNTLRVQADLQAGDKLTIYQHGNAIIILLPDKDVE